MDKQLTPTDLSPDQRDVYDDLVTWSKYLPGMLLTIGGYAGCGKTTLLGVFASQTKLRIAYCAFTGRAASVLTRKLKAAGSNAVATTIHRLIYQPMIDPETEEILGWKKRQSLKNEYDLIVIDEASMVGGSMLKDLQEYGVPILAVGDHGQLPPVADSGELMKAPMLTLEKIHRQASGNPIIKLAHQVRTTGEIGDVEGITYGGRRDFDQAYFAARTNVGSPLDVGAFCWTNRNRVRLNGVVRNALGFRGRPRAGEVVICLRNMAPIFNGMRGRLVDESQIGAKLWELSLNLEFPEEGIQACRYIALAPQFCREKPYTTVEELQERGVDVRTVKQAGALFDFGYVLTCHKAQGSSWEHAIVYLDRPMDPDGDEYRRWVYTAVTRAAERLTVLT